MIPRRYADLRPSDRTALRGAHAPDRVSRWEAVFSEQVGRSAAVAVGSGRRGMVLTLASLDPRPGDEIVLPAYTLKALVPLLETIGLTPVFADIDPATFNLRPDAVARAVTPATRAILATHLFGCPCDIDGIFDAVRRAHTACPVRVIEDCAHSAGALLHGKPTGAFGHAAFFSFETIKPINTYGGGMIVTDDPFLAESARRDNARLAGVTDIAPKVRAAQFERVLFRSSLAALPLALLASPAANRAVSSLYRLLQHPPAQALAYAPAQAAIGLEKIRDLDARTRRRRTLAHRLRERLPPAVRPQHPPPEADPNYYFFVALVPDEPGAARRFLLRHGFDAGIAGEIADYCPGAESADCPVAREVFAHAIHLPLHEAMSTADVDRLAAVLCRRYA